MLSMDTYVRHVICRCICDICRWMKGHWIVILHDIWMYRELEWHHSHGLYMCLINYTSSFWCCSLTWLLCYCGPSPDPPIGATRYFKKKKVKGKADFWVLKNSSQWGMVLFGVATYFLFLFLNGETLSKNKNPNMTSVRKKWSVKTRFWVRGSSYLLGRYLMRGSTPLGPELGLYWWTGYMGAYGLKIKQTLG